MTNIAYRGATGSLVKLSRKETDAHKII